MYFDMDIYNYKYLSEKDKIFIDGMWWGANMMTSDPDVLDNYRGSKTLCNIASEIADGLVENFRERVSLEAVDTIVSIIDAMDDKVFEAIKKYEDEKQEALGDIQVGDIIFDSDGECYGKVHSIVEDEKGKGYRMIDFLCPASDFNEDGEPILYIENPKWYYIRRLEK